MWNQLEIILHGYRRIRISSRWQRISVLLTLTDSRQRLKVSTVVDEIQNGVGDSSTHNASSTFWPIRSLHNEF